MLDRVPIPPPALPISPPTFEEYSHLTPHLRGPSFPLGCIVLDNHSTLHLLAPHFASPLPLYTTTIADPSRVTKEAPPPGFLSRLPVAQSETQTCCFPPELWPVAASKQAAPHRLLPPWCSCKQRERVPADEASVRENKETREKHQNASRVQPARNATSPPPDRFLARRCWPC